MDVFKHGEALDRGACITGHDFGQRLLMRALVQVQQVVGERRKRAQMAIAENGGGPGVRLKKAQAG